MFTDKIARINKLQQEIAALRCDVMNLETEFEVITNQYINGCYGNASIGDMQRRLLRKRDTCLRQIESKKRQLARLMFK